jgi:hypothetical protein
MDGGILWFGSFVEAGLFAYFMTTIYVSGSADRLVVCRLGVVGREGRCKVSSPPIAKHEGYIIYDILL